MKTLDVHNRAIYLAILLVLSPVLMGAQGSRFPGLPASSTDTHNKQRGPVEVTFTKWITTAPQMVGVTGGDVPGTFVGEVLQVQVSQRPADECYAPPACGRVMRLEALYEVQAGNHSFAALVRGGTSGDTGAAVLDGVILHGWRTGARVHVEFHTLLPPSPTEPGCAGAPAGAPCFQGVISIERPSKD